MTFKSPLSVRHSLIGTSLLTAISFCASGTARAADWVGAVDNDWNTDLNWSGGSVPTGEIAVVNTAPADNDITPFIATIFSEIPAPGNIEVGFGTGAEGRLDHTAGVAATGDGNWMVVGRDSGAGTYNLADTEGSGGILTGFGQGSGSMSTPAADLIIGLGEGGDGTVNVNTSGTVNVGNELKVGEPGAAGVLNMDAGMIVTGLNAAGTNTFFGRGGGNGSLNLSGGTLDLAGQLFFGADADSVGAGVIDGGQINTGLLVDDDNAANTSVGSNGGTGTLELSGATLNLGSRLIIGNGGGSTGSVVMDSGTINLGTGTRMQDGETVNFVGELRIGNGGGVGEMQVNGGDINSGGWNFVGEGGGSDGTLTMNGGTITNASETQVGRDGTGVMTLSGGTYANTGAAFNVGVVAGTGTLTLDDPNSLLDASGQPLRIGVFGGGSNGTVNLIDGTIVSSQLLLGDGTQLVNLEGGTLRVSQITGGPGLSDVFFSGTQLIAENPGTPFISGISAAEVSGNGLRVDSNGFDLAVPQALTGTAGVTKSGAGTLTLTGEKTFAGDSVIEAGKLTINTFAFGLGGFTVADGSAFGTIRDFPDEVLDVPFLTFGDGGATTLEIDLGEFGGNSASPLVDVTGTLTLNGAVTVNVFDSAPEVGTVPLVSYDTQAGSGAFELGSLPEGVTATLSDDGSGLVSLDVTEVVEPTTGF